jgi:hypothetical protein
MWCFGWFVFPIVALLVAMGAFGLRDLFFAIELRSSTRAARGILLLAAPVLLSLMCLMLLVLDM